jgi:Holliday junction resolvase|tara:strand:+ start:157554 stop:158087 length:534 start_codon:yes stop_codon:yes gene_type:complete
LDFEYTYNKIFNLLENEDASINLLKPKAGIFFAPELYLVFQIGRLLKTHELKVFGEEVCWLREYSLNNGGPTDLLFKNKDGELYVFECKVASKLSLYFNDINKLKKLCSYRKNPIKQKFFIAIVDVFSNQGLNDGRLTGLKDEHIHQLIPKFKMFHTEYSAYPSKDNSCLLGMWKVS